MELYRQMLLSIYNIRITLIKKSSKQESASGESENKESNDDNTESRSSYDLIQDIYITLATDYIHYLYAEVPEELYPAFPEQYKFIPNV